jgi:hypothetical protein
VSPILAPPNRGAPDWQGSQAWDGPVLWQDNPGNIATGIASGLLPVNSWASTALSVFLQAGTCLLSLDWTADSAGSQDVGGRNVALDTALKPAADQASGFNAIIRNMGPFLRVNLFALGANYTPSVYEFGTNRTLPVEISTAWPVLIDQQNVSLAADSEANLYPLSYYAGPINVYAQVPATGWLVALQYLSPANTYDTTALFDPTAAAYENVTWVAPLGAWRIIVQNTTASPGDYYLTCTPSPTGSS